MVSIGMVVLGATDMGRAIGFWTRALGYELSEGGAGADWSSLAPAGGLGTGIGRQCGAALAGCRATAGSGEGRGRDLTW